VLEWDSTAALTCPLLTAGGASTAATVLCPPPVGAGADAAMLSPTGAVVPILVHDAEVRRGGRSAGEGADEGLNKDGPSMGVTGKNAGVHPNLDGCEEVGVGFYELRYTDYALILHKSDLIRKQ
jgi:hypothetical protein